MPNPYVNKVVQSNGTTLIDISDTTAVAADVASGKSFYSASGQKVLGTGSTGSGEISGLSGKKVVFLGDSIGYGEGNNGHSFVDIISEKGICSSVIKECHSSATVGPYQPWSEAEGYDCLSMIQAQSSNISNADIVFIEYGGNDTYAIDHNLVTLGTINDAASTNTFFGYCRRAIQNVRAINPTVEIYWLFPILYNLPPTPLVSYANGDWMTVTSKAITQVCDDCGVSYYGLYSDLNPVKGAGHVINDAAGHPSEAGHQIIAETVMWGYPYHAFPYRPSRSITLASDGTYDSTFRVLVALLQVGVDVDIRYDGLIFHPQKSDSSYIVFSAVTASGTTETEYVLVVNSSGTAVYSTTRTLTNIPWGGGGGGDDPTPPDPTGYETIYDGDVNVKSSNPNYFQINNVSAVPQQSETWRITWKGVTAEFTSVYSSQINTYYVGNPGVIGGTDDGSGVPVVIYGSTSVQITGVTSDNAGTTAIKIERGTAS